MNTYTLNLDAAIELTDEQLRRASRLIAKALGLDAE